jgi:hypothetical protein
MKRTLAILIGLGLMGGFGAVRANTVTVTLQNPSQSGNPGDLLQFFGTIQNDLASGPDSIYLNGATGTPVSADLPIDTLPLFLSYILTSPPALAPGDSTAAIELFDITISLTAAPGAYVGNSVSFSGGPLVDSQDPLGIVYADVTVNPTSQPAGVPEPGTGVLLLTGLAAWSGLRRRRAKQPSRG